MPHGLDGKGCSYKKSIIDSIGGFDSENFFTGGEDADLSSKIIKKWKIANPDVKTYHLHRTNLKKRIKKEIHYAQIAGLTVRKHFHTYPWGFKLNLVLKIFLFFLLLASLFLKSINFWFIFLMIFILANIRFPFQFKRLWKNPKILLVPFLNLFVYFLYVVFFLRAWIFKPVV